MNPTYAPGGLGTGAGLQQDIVVAPSYVKMNFSNSNFRPELRFEVSSTVKSLAQCADATCAAWGTAATFVSPAVASAPTGTTTREFMFPWSQTRAATYPGSNSSICKKKTSNL